MSKMRTKVCILITRHSRSLFSNVLLVRNIKYLQNTTKQRYIGGTQLNPIDSFNEPMETLIELLIY